MAISGRNTQVYVSLTEYNGYNIVDDLNDITQEDTAEQLDSTKFGASRRTFLPGFPGGVWNLTGFYNTLDSTGQRILENAYNDETSIWAKVLYDGTNGFRQLMKVSDFTKHSAVGDIVSVTISLLPQAEPSRVGAYTWLEVLWTVQQK